MKINDIDVHIKRKPIKHLHVSVCPPDGQVRVSAPKQMSDDSIRLAVISKLTWIQRQRKRFQEQPRQSPRCYVSGECHYFLGQAFRLKEEYIKGNEKQHVRVTKTGNMSLFVRANASIASKQRLMERFYREALKQHIAELLPKWQPIIDREITFWGIKKMKTKWGSCHTIAGRIWLNLELAKKPLSCVEYVLVHEMVHLLEPSHNARFYALMTQFLPHWQSLRDELNALPVKHEVWEL